MERWRVGPDAAGERLDRAVANHWDAARNQVQAWIREGLVQVNGVIRPASHRLAEGDEVSCSPRLKDTAIYLTPQDGDLRVLHEDEHLIVLDKPAGIAVHPGAGRPEGTLANHLLHAYPELASVGGVGRPGIVHRLDIDTTGVLVVARTEKAYRHLSSEFAERRVAKTYWGIVFGVPTPGNGKIEMPIGRHASRRKEMTVRPDGRPALSRYNVLAEGDGVSLLEIEIETGRTHQIRVHLKAIHHPLVGDATYAGNRWRGAPKTRHKILAGFSRPALHAWKVELEHPATGERARFVASAPEDLERLWQELTGHPLPAPLSR